MVIDNKECNEIMNPEKLVEYFRSDHEPTVNKVMKCFNSLFFGEFKGFTKKTVFNELNISETKKEELISDAFFSGLAEFYFYIRNKGFKYNRATIKTILFTFCKRSLYRPVNEQLEIMGVYGGDPEEILKTLVIKDTFDPETIKEEKQLNNKNESLFRAGMQKLDPKCANLIKWRKFEELSIDEIAKRSKINPEKITDEVFNCWKKLKRVINKLRN